MMEANATNSATNNRLNPFDKLKDLNIFSRVRGASIKTSSWFKFAFKTDIESEDDIICQQPTGFNKIPDRTLNLLSPQSYANLFEAMDDLPLHLNEYNNFNIPKQRKHYDFHPIPPPQYDPPPIPSISLKQPPLNRKLRKRASAKSFIFDKEEILNIINSSFNNDDDDDFKDILQDFEDINKLNIKKEIIERKENDNNDLIENRNGLINIIKNENKSILNTDNILKSINDRFKYIKQLGIGASCRVLLCLDRKINKLFALKELPKKNKLSAMQFDREVRLLLILRECRNENIMKYIDCYMDKQCYYIVLEYCSGPTLLKRIICIKNFNEIYAAKLIKLILIAINEMHQKNIVHRDLKLNNLIFDKPFNNDNNDKNIGNEANLKLIDFGDSRFIEDDKEYKTCIGTLHYIAPEMMNKQKKGWQIKKSDIWSIGIITFILVTGKLPFNGESKKETLKLIKMGKYKYPNNCNLSRKCKDFISKLLEMDTKKRINCEEALKHEWITQETTIINNDDDDEILMVYL